MDIEMVVMNIYQKEKFNVNKEELKGHALFAVAFGLIEVAKAIRKSNETEET